MRLLAMVIVAAVPTTAVTAPSLSQVPDRSSAPLSRKSCAPLSPQWARGADGRFLRDSREPVQFDLHQAVARSVDGCPVPAVLRRDVDGGRTGSPAPTRGAVRLLTR